MRYVPVRGRTLQLGGGGAGRLHPGVGEGPREDPDSDLQCPGQPRHQEGSPHHLEQPVAQRERE